MDDNGQKVVGYARVSTALQADEGVSLDAQGERIRAWAASRGLDPEGISIKVDAGLSGKRADNRPALAEALDLVTLGRPGILVVYSLSRLARSVRDTLAIAERLDKAGANLVSLSESIDTTSASGKMLFRLLAVLAEFERDLIVERTRGAVAHKRSRNERVGQVPLGKRLDPDGVKLHDDVDEQAAVELIRDMSASGQGARSIARAMTAAGIATKTGRPTWSDSSIRGILKRSPHAPR